MILLLADPRRAFPPHTAPPGRGSASFSGITKPLVLAQMGQLSMAPTYWTLPTAMLSGAATAGGIAMINAEGTSAASRP
jgi:hypothetical protein